MPMKKRKSLDDALAKEFVYGENGASEKPAPVEEKKPVPVEDKKPSIMEKLQPIEKEATKRLTVDLAESMHRKLSILAAKTSRTKADIVRMLLDDALSDVDE